MAKARLGIRDIQVSGQWRQKEQSELEGCRYVGRGDGGLPKESGSQRDRQRWRQRGGQA